MTIDLNNTAALAFLLIHREEDHAVAISHLSTLTPPFHAIWVRAGIRLLNGVSIKRMGDLCLAEFALMGGDKQFDVVGEPGNVVTGWRAP